MEEGTGLINLNRIMNDDDEEMHGDDDLRVGGLQLNTNSQSSLN